MFRSLDAALKIVSDFDGPALFESWKLSVNHVAGHGPRFRLSPGLGPVEFLAVRTLDIGLISTHQVQKASGVKPVPGRRAICFCLENKSSFSQNCSKS